MVDFAFLEGLIYVVAGRCEEKAGEVERENGECCGVEDAEEGDAGAFDMHDGNLRCIIGSITLLVEEEW